MVRRPMMILGALVTLSLLLSACASGTPEVVRETVIVEKTIEVEVEVTPSPQPEEPDSLKTLVVCMGREPDSLYVYGSNTLESSHVRQAVYDGAATGAMDYRTYSYQPTILKKLPDLEDDDAVINAVTVQAGDIVVDDADRVVELDTGVRIRPAGCRNPDCVVEFTGAPIEMDQMVVKFELIEDIIWSNGDPLSADDSVYGFELNADPDTPASLYRVERTASYEAMDDIVVVWTGLPGYTDELYYTNFWHPFPRKLWQDELGYTAADLLEAEESARTPMGWGAFVITEWVAGDHITVEKNSNYFRADEGLPYLDAVIFRFVSDSNAAVAQLISGECDIVTQDTSLEDHAELLLRLEQEGVIETAFVTSAVWEHVDFGIDPVSDYDRPDFFGDVRVRQAIAMCLDRQRVVNTLLYGRSTVMDSYIPPEHPLYAGDRLTTYDYDPEAGVALLEEIGWMDIDGDGTREAQDVEGVPDGTRLEFEWGFPAQPMREAYVRMLEQDLAECGIQVDPQSYPQPEFYADGPDGPLFGRRFDLASFAWLADVLPPCDLYLGSEIPTEENGWIGSNNTGFDDAAYNEQCARALDALPGTEEYVEAHKEAQRIFSEQLPVIPLFPYLKIAASRPEVEGLQVDPTENSEMWNIEAFDLER